MTSAEIAQQLSSEQIQLLLTLAHSAGRWSFAPDELVPTAEALAQLGIVSLFHLPNGDPAYYVLPVGLPVVAAMENGEQP